MTLFLFSLSWACGTKSGPGFARGTDSATTTHADDSDPDSDTDEVPVGCLDEPCDLLETKEDLLDLCRDAIYSSGGSVIGLGWFSESRGPSSSPHHLGFSCSAPELSSAKCETLCIEASMDVEAFDSAAGECQCQVEVPPEGVLASDLAGLTCKSDAAIGAATVALHTIVVNGYTDSDFLEVTCEGSSRKGGCELALEQFNASLSPVIEWTLAEETADGCTLSPF